MAKNKKKKEGSKRLSFKAVVLSLFVLFLPTQFGKHFFLPFSYLSGIRVDYLAPTLYLTDLLFLLLLIFNYRLVVKAFKNKRLLLVFGLLLIPVLFAQSKELALYRYLKIFELTAVFLIFKNSVIPIKRLVYIFLASSLFTFSLAVLQFVNKSSLQGMFYFFGERFLSLSTPDVAKASLQGVEFLRPYATFSHPNSLAGFFLLVYVFFLTSRFNSLLKNLLIFLSAFLVLISFSKIAILTMIAVTIVFFGTIWKKIDCKFCIASRIIVLTILGLLFSLAQSDPASWEKRLTLLYNAYGLIASSPLFGVGPGNYIIAQSKIAKEFFVLTQPVHNIFVLFLAEVGLVVGGYILYLLIKYFTPLLKRLDFVLLVIVVVATGLFDHYWLTLQQNLLLLGVIFGLISRRPSSS